MRNQALVLVVISVIISICISTKRLGKWSLVVKSSCFDHQVTDFIEVNGSCVPGVKPRGNGMYAVVMKKTLGKNVTTGSFHVGVLKFNNFETRLADMKTFVEKERSKGGEILVLFSVGTTHEKTVMEEMRNGILAKEYSIAADVLRLYGMKKFLSIAHGCRQPYILIHDLRSSETLSERTGMCGGVLCAKA